jgi:hypothetical protein
MRFKSGALAIWVALLLVTGTAASAAACSTGNITYKFVNNCVYDIWLGEFNSSESVGILPTSGTWQINAGADATVCLPTTWISGRFWPRTGCSGSGDTLNCVTGQCGAAGQGAADCTKAGVTGNNPQTIFEVTTNSNGGNYDLSLVNGYNVPMAVVVDGSGCTRDRAGCVADLLNSCPAALQVTVPPTASGDSNLPCGQNTFCPSGQCLNGSTCLVGCLDPGDACLQIASSVEPLNCNGAVAGATGTSCSGQSVGVNYLSMYLAKNYGGEDAKGNKYTGDNVGQASSNQGTPTCFADVDCPVNAPNCVTTGFPSAYDPPKGAGVCLNLAQSGSSNSYGQGACSQSNVGKPCGGLLGSFSNALGYTCQPVTYTQTGGSSQTAYACLPSLANGLGSCETPSSGASLYSGVAGVTNAAWMTAAQQAGAKGKAFYQIFKQACPTAYSWQYDDIAADFGCSSVKSFTITFCPAS